MRVTDSKNSLQSVKSIARSLLPKDLSIALSGILGAAPVPPPLGEGPERLLFAVRTSFERLFHPNRHWNQFSHISCFSPHPSCFHFASQGAANPFAAIEGAYSQALEKLEAARKPAEVKQPSGPERAGFAQMNEGFASSLASDVQRLFNEVDRLLRSDNPAERMLAGPTRLKALQLLQLVYQLIFVRPTGSGPAITSMSVRS